jgi:hypothetical protein
MCEQIDNHFVAAVSAMEVSRPRGKTRRRDAVAADALTRLRAVTRVGVSVGGKYGPDA